MNAHEDCAYWGLTPLQCMRHHVRVSNYHARRARWHADRSKKFGGIAMRVQLAGLTLALLAFVLQALS